MTDHSDTVTPTAPRRPKATPGRAGLRTPHRPALPAAELRRFTGSSRAWLVLVGLLLVPLVYGGLYTWANESPQTRIDQVNAAVVNLDEPVTLKGADGKDQIVPLGRQVVGKLTSSASSSNYRWELTDAETARSGLDTGRYAAVLTIPADFSRSATSTSGPVEQTRAARLQMRTNDAVNYLDGSIAKAIATTTSEETARLVTEGYLGAMYAGYGQLRGQLGTAATGAGSLADGAGKLTTGANEAAGGAGTLADGVTGIATGATSLADGATKLASGASQAASGATELAAGMATIDTNTAALPGQTRQLATGAAQLAGGVTRLSSGAAGLTSGASQFATGANQFAASIDPLVVGAAGAAQGAATLEGGIAAYTQGVSGLAAQCAASGAAPAFCTQLTALAGQGPGLAAGATGVKSGSAGVSQGLAGLQAGATQLGSSAVAYAAGASQFASGASQLAPGATQLSVGLTQLADGIPALADGIHRSAGGASALAKNLPTLAGGAQSLAQGAAKLSAGAVQASTGAGRLETGLGSLASGSQQLGTGAKELSAGLAQGVSKIPDYTDAERTRLAEVAARPVVADVTRVNAVRHNGSGLAPYFFGLALWVGAMAMYLLLRPLSSRALASSAASPLIALSGYLPGALLGIGQAVLLAVLLQFGVGIQAASTWALLGVAVLASLAFVAVNQALVGLLGAPGRFVAVLLTGLQLAAAGGTYPVATAPAFFGHLHDWLPFSYAVDALRKVIAGSSVGLGQDLGVLVLSLGVGLAVTMYAAHRQRVWTLRRLHPVVVA